MTRLEKSIRSGAADIPAKTERSVTILGTKSEYPAYCVSNDPTGFKILDR
jgi:hypothetical protein